MEEGTKDSGKMINSTDKERKYGNMERKLMRVTLCKGLSKEKESFHGMTVPTMKEILRMESSTE